MLVYHYQRQRHTQQHQAASHHQLRQQAEYLVKSLSISFFFFSFLSMLGGGGKVFYYPANKKKQSHSQRPSLHQVGNAQCNLSDFCGARKKRELWPKEFTAMMTPRTSDFFEHWREETWPACLTNASLTNRDWCSWPKQARVGST